MGAGICHRRRQWGWGRETHAGGRGHHGVLAGEVTGDPSALLLLGAKPPPHPPLSQGSSLHPPQPTASAPS
jgi:hypothetical protein